MKPFSLSAVLKYRKQLEDSAVTKLTEAQLEMLRAEQELHSINDEYDKITSQLDQFQSSGIGIEELLQYENRIAWLKLQKLEKTKAFDATIENVNNKRLNVITRSRNKKILEQLKQRQNQGWQNYLNKKENNQLDEIAVLSHERKRHK